MEEVYEYIDLRNQTHSTFDRLRRIDSRDYSFSASTFITIYDDRIEFVSIGGLLSGISENDIMMGLSICRNPKLAAVFYRLHLIEAYGTGIPKIMRAYKDSNKKPMIKVSDHAFKIILPNLNYSVDFDEQNRFKYSDLNVNGMINDKVELRYIETNEMEVMKYIQLNGCINRATVEKLLGVSQSTSNRLLRNMVEQEKLIVKGNGKMTKYYLK